MGKNELFKGKHLEHIAAISGLGLGVGAASAIGTAVGSAGLLGTIGSFFGYTLAASTPIGWIIGGALAGGTALKYGAKIIAAKGKSDGIYKIMESRRLEQKEKRLRHISTKLDQVDINKALSLWEKISNESLAEPDAINQIIEGLKQGSNSANDAIDLACDILGLDINQFLTEKQVTIKEINLIIRLALVMLFANKDFKERQFDTITNLISDSYMIDIYDADYLVDVAIEDYLAIGQRSKIDIRPKLVFLTVAECFYFNTHLHQQILKILEKVALADGVFNDDEKAVHNFAKRCFKMAKDMNIYETILAQLPIEEPNLFLPDNQKFAKKVQNAIDSYAPGVHPDQVVGLYDNTKFGQGDKGFILNRLGIINDQGDIIFYNEIRRAKFAHNGIILHAKDEDFFLNYQINPASKLPNFLNLIAEPNQPIDNQCV